MTQLNWDAFEALPGGSTHNWERLCRSVVFRNFGSLGRFRSWAMQPGVEFHLKIERPSKTLGDSTRWWGWQCRWYTLPPGSQIGTNRRAKIIAAIRATEKHVPGITDWVLWTKRSLTPTDQAWYEGISTSMRLHLWTEHHLDDHLVGEATILRRTFFGDLAFTRDTLRLMRNAALAPVRDRWIPEVHVPVTVERSVRRVLAEPSEWNHLSRLESPLTRAINDLTAAEKDIPLPLRGDGRLLLHDLTRSRDVLRSIDQASNSSAMSSPLYSAALDRIPPVRLPQARRLARALRRAGSRAALPVQGCLSHHHRAIRLLSALRTCLSTKIVAVIGQAGHGKSHLSAALTAETPTRPSGVYLEGWPLERTGVVDDLLPRLRNIPKSSFDQFLDAIESAGIRARARIPIVIDGLSESQDPATWKSELVTLRETLSRFDHVVLVVTLRPSARELIVPPDVLELHLSGFATVTDEAVAQYFHHFKISLPRFRVTRFRFSHPLFLRIFCEATNPDRLLMKHPEDVPTSLVDVFHRYRDTVVARVANAPGTVRREVRDVHRALDSLALTLWETRRASIPYDDLRSLIHDDGQDWTLSLARALVDGGILRRDPHEPQLTAILYDSLAGFLVADALVRTKTADEFEAWITDPLSLTLLNRDEKDPHPLASDVCTSMATLVPRKYRFQLWKLLPDPLRTQALFDAADLSGPLMDDETLRQLRRMSPKLPSPGQRELLLRYWELCDAPDHPLNAEFLDRLLCGLSVADRDLRWSEWVRRNQEELLSEVAAFEDHWIRSEQRRTSDHLRALWVKWLLTSTVRHLRDHATRALYWYGRYDPVSLFRLTHSGLHENDPYVPERLLAATFGVVMAAAAENRTFEDELIEFLRGLLSCYFGGGASIPTDHYLIREYVRGIFRVVRHYYPRVWASTGSSEAPRFAPSPRLSPIPSDDDRVKDDDLVYGYDFKNYTVGRLVPSRGNYEFDHPEYQEVLSWIRARVWELGWRRDSAGSVDKQILSSRRHREPLIPSQPETYKKKYGWIGFFEAAGRLWDDGRRPNIDDGRLSDVDIDPSFPLRPPTADVTIPQWLPGKPQDLRTWVEAGKVYVPTHLLRPNQLNGRTGPWIALDGFLKQEDAASNREVFGFLRCMLVRRNEETVLRDALRTRAYPGNHWIPDPPGSYYSFAGEIPWGIEARRGLHNEGLGELYRGRIEVADGVEVVVELPVHEYAWESYHSSANESGGGPVPAITLADRFDLRAVPNSLDWSDSRGSAASMTLTAPVGFGDGRLLYIREDIIRTYCDEHEYALIWMVWGERSPYVSRNFEGHPDWALPLYATYRHIWRHVATLEEVSGA